jgi:nudix-type nucleoside diphosphatase (YffH/AdpP family)
MPDQIISSDCVFRGFFNVHCLKIRQPNGTEINRAMVEQQHGAVVLPYDAGRRVALLISEHRHPLIFSGGPILLEPIAGAIEEGAPEDTARREAMEEAGVRLDTLEPVGRAYVSPGTTTERIHLFLAPYAQHDLQGEGGGLAEEQESISAMELPLEGLWAMLGRGEIEDCRTILLLQALYIRRPELFTAEPD